MRAVPPPTNFTTAEHNLWKKDLVRIIGNIWNLYRNLGRMFIFRTFKSVKPRVKVSESSFTEGGTVILVKGSNPWKSW